ncbi:MAG: hypothetical protein ACOYBE_10460 [Blautia sp.]|jgi:hypothetical protein
MPGITVEQFGFTFILECLEAYWGDALLFFLLFLVSLLILLLVKKRGSAGIFLSIFFFLLLTVYNPVLVYVLIPRLGLETIYYRLFWLMPVTAVLAYVIVYLCTAIRYTAIQIPLLLLFGALILFTGQPLKSAVSPSLPDNIYKVPQDLVDACDIIHADSDEEQPTVVFDVNLNMVARQYDPSLLLALNRNAVLYRAGSQTVDPVDTESFGYKAQKAIMDVLYYGEDIPMNRFQAGLRWRKADYLVVPLNNPKHDFIQEAGCISIGECGKYQIYRCELPQK